MLYTALIVVIVGSLGTIGYVAARPKPPDPFTEFYILGPAGRAADYPKEVSVGSSASVIVGVANHLNAPATYRVEITVAGVKSGELAPFDLASGQQREQPATFTPTATGTRQPVEFILYKDGQIDSSLKPLRLWIDVVP